jgi:hypothetical protein
LLLLLLLIKGMQVVFSCFCYRLAKVILIVGTIHYHMLASMHHHSWPACKDGAAKKRPRAVVEGHDG